MQYLASPLHFIFDALPAWLRRVPQFEISKSIIVALTVLVVNVLLFGKCSAKAESHDPSMFKDSLLAIFMGNRIKEALKPDRYCLDRKRDVALRVARFAVSTMVFSPWLRPVRGMISTWTKASIAHAGEVVSGKKLTQHSPWVPFSIFTLRALHLRTWPEAPVYLHYYRLGLNYGRMLL